MVTVWSSYYTLADAAQNRKGLYFVAAMAHCQLMLLYDLYVAKLSEMSPANRWASGK